MSYEENPKNKYDVEEISSGIRNSEKKSYNECGTDGDNMSDLKDSYCNIIGNWLVDKKGCQKNEFSGGYAENVNLAGNVIDALGLRYLLDEGMSYNSFDFYGYAVDFCPCIDDVGDRIRAIKDTYIYSIKNETSRWNGGFSDISFYIAYPGEITPESLISYSEKYGIGLLRLDKDGSEVIEECEPVPYGLVRMSNKVQRSIGTFQKALNDKSYFRDIFYDTEKFFDAFLRPKKEHYAKGLAFRHAYSYCKNKECAGLLERICMHIIDNYPNVIVQTAGTKHSENVMKFINVDNLDEILRIRGTKDYF